MDAYENSDQSLKERSKKTAVAAMRKVEDTLDEFDVVSRSPVNLPVFTGSKNWHHFPLFYKNCSFLKIYRWKLHD